MQTTASFLAEIIHQDDIVEPIEPKLKLEARLPDFLVFRIDSRRDVLLLVEIKSEDSEEPQKALLSIFLQAEIQAKFAFERWPSPSFSPCSSRGRNFSCTNSRRLRSFHFPIITSIRTHDTQITCHIKKITATQWNLSG